jgi:hypothetical protein
MHGRWLLLSSFLVPLAHAQPVHGGPCAVSESDRRWIDGAIETWGKAAGLLGHRIDAMPWTILYDAQCVVHLAPRDTGSRKRRAAAGDGASASLEVSFNGKPVPARSLRYRKRFVLPSGQRQTSKAVAFTALAEDGQPFFVMALPSVWRRDPRTTPDEDVEEFLRGVLAHEMTHTIHMASIAAAMEALDERYTMPEELDDDYLQSVFEDDAEYVAAYDREIALYARAAAETDDGAARDLARQALDASEGRRRRFFQGDRAYFLEAEPLFLQMEGVASWVAYSVVGRGADPLRFSGRFWSQQQGLLLFLLIDRFDPQWKSRVFEAAAPDPFSMLRSAVGGAEPPPAAAPRPGRF